MTDRPRYDDLSDEELESLIRCLPGRGPSSDLRARVLSHGLRAGRRRSRAPRPALALAALFALLLADLLILSSQNAGLGMKTAPAAVVRADTSATQNSDLAWLSESGRPGLTQRIALLRAQKQTRQHTYSLLRRSLLENAEGG